MNYELQDNLRIVIGYLAGEFSCGAGSVSAEDDIGYGRDLGDVVADLADSHDEMAGVDADAASAVAIMNCVFAGGFSLASAADVDQNGASLADLAFSAKGRLLQAAAPQFR